MTILSISAAAETAGIDRRTIQRAIKTGRMSATVNAAGDRGVDLAELIRTFGPLRKAPPQAGNAAMSQPVTDTVLVEVLRDQVRQAQEQLRQAAEREQRLMLMLESEQTARRELEIKLLAAPRKREKASDMKHFQQREKKFIRLKIRDRLSLKMN